MMRPDFPATRRSSLMPDACHVQRIGNRGILFRLDHNPACITDILEHIGEGGKINHAITRHREHTVQHAFEKTPVSLTQLAQHVASNVLDVNMIDP